MGLPMVRCLLNTGHVVKVHNRSQARAREAVRAGAQHADKGSVAERVDAVVTMLPAGNDVRDVLVGPTGLFAHAREGTLFIDCSTIDVDTARALADDAHAAGMKMIDAPVSGGVAKAELGTLTFMVGGDEDELQQARPILEAMGQNIIHAGSSGAGQAAKACNNMMLAICMIAVSEAFTLAQRVGLDVRTLFEICQKSSGQSWVMNHYHPLPGLVETSPANNDYKPGFTASMMLKDLQLSQNAAKSGNLHTPLGALVTDLYEKFVESGSGELDFSAIVRLISE
jgi:3-hydroxyisobutyrate dehydrogenase